MPIITVPKVLREKLGDDGADALVDLFNQSEQRQKEDVLEFVEEKFEWRLNEELSTLRIEMNERFATVNERFAELEVKIEATKSYMVRWMFAFWVAQVGVILGILFAFFK